jgi:hypothetical protein
MSRLSLGSDISELEDDEDDEIMNLSSKKATEIVFKSDADFKRRRMDFAEFAYLDINKRAFGNKLPKIPIKWRKSSTYVGLFSKVRCGTSGISANSFLPSRLNRFPIMYQKLVDGQKTYCITLSRNYIVNPQMLLETLAHEMAHACAAIIDQDDDRSHHSPVWWKWARIAMAAYSQKIKITVKCNTLAQWD